MSKKPMIVGASPFICPDGHGPVTGSDVCLCGATVEPNPIVTVMFHWEGGKGGNVVVVMPLIDGGRGMVLCYVHLGQHSSRQRNYFTDKCRTATPSEYAPLLKELTSAPYFYRFRIVQRRPKHGTPMEG